MDCGSSDVLTVHEGYQYNPSKQRVRVNLPDGSFRSHEQIGFGKSSSGKKYWMECPPVSSRRTSAKGGDDGAGTGLWPTSYSVSSLNHDTGRTVPNQVDVLGVANPTADVTVRVVGGTTYTAGRKGEYYHHALTVGNNVYPRSWSDHDKRLGISDLHLFRTLRKAPDRGRTTTSGLASVICICFGPSGRFMAQFFGPKTGP